MTESSQSKPAEGPATLAMESRRQGSVSWSTYAGFFWAGRSGCMLAAFALCHVLAEALDIGEKAELVQYSLGLSSLTRNTFSPWKRF